MQGSQSIFFWYLNKTGILVCDFLYSTATDKEIIEDLKVVLSCPQGRITKKGKDKYIWANNLYDKC